MASTSNDASSTSINTKKLRRALLKTLPKRRTPVDLGILVKYWPLGEMEGTRKDQAFLKGLTDERVKCGEYNSQYKAYPIFLSKKVGSSASSKTRAFCPAAYRPALRILNCRIAFTLVGLETKPDPSLMNKRRPASPDVENVADEVAALSDSDSHRLVAEKYALCRDGYLRNVQYHTVVRREFFAWLDKTYYDNKVGTDRLPLKKPMQVQRCDILEAWLAVELLGANHSSDAIIRLINDSEKMKVLEAAKDVFRLNWELYGKRLAHYGRILDPEDTSDKIAIQAQLGAGNLPHPIDEDFSVIKRNIKPLMKELLDQVLLNPMTGLHPTSVVIPDEEDRGSLAGDKDFESPISSSGSEADSSDSSIEVGGGDEDIMMVNLDTLIFVICCAYCPI
jgi:hypothetical protein